MKEEYEFTMDIRIRFNQGDQVVYGNGISKLLELTEKTHSILAASKEMGISYPKALKIVKRAEEHFQEPLLTRKIGGEEGGGSELTDFGKILLRQFQVLNNDVESYALKKMEEYFSEPISIKIINP